MFSAGKFSTLPNGDLLLQSAPERYVAWALVFLVVAPIAFFLWRRGIGGRYPPGAFIVSWIIPLFVLPGIAMESTRLTADALIVKTGYWFAPSTETFPFAGLKWVDAERVGPKERLYWNFHYYGTGYRRLNLPDLLEDHRAQVADSLRSRGVSVALE